MERDRINLDGINILLEKSSRARRMSISIRPATGVRIAVPSGISFEIAKSFAESKINWIKKNHTKIKKLEKEYGSGNDLSRPLNIRKSRSILKNRLRELADRYSFSYNRVFIRNQKTRWGSCSGKNNINLNINLVRLPGELVDYVILHELVHTRIKNHGKSFWRELDLYVGNSKKIDAKLKKYNLAILSNSLSN